MIKIPVFLFFYDRNYDCICKCCFTLLTLLYIIKFLGPDLQLFFTYDDFMNC